MKKLAIAAAISLLTASNAFAEPKFYILGDLGFADADDGDTSTYFDIGGGVKFNNNVELELAYNDFGDLGLDGIDFTSYSLGLNLGGKVSESVRLFAILGVEDLEADGTFNSNFGDISISESSTEAFIGIGAAFDVAKDVAIRPRIISHDSGDLLTFSIGIAKYF